MDQDEIWHRCGPRGGRGSTQYPPTPGVQGVHFGRNFIKQKLLGTPNLVMVGHLIGPQIWIWKDLGPVSFWSHGHSLSRGVYKIKVVVNGPNSAWPQGQANVCLSPHTLLITINLKIQYSFKNLI